jgi:hypothetical protein
MFAVYSWVPCNLAPNDLSIKKNLVADKKKGVHNSGNVKFIFVKSYIVNNMFNLRLTNINSTYSLRLFHPNKTTD